MKIWVVYYCYMKMVDYFFIWLGATKCCLDVLDWLLHPFRNWARSAIFLKFRRSGCRRCSATNNTPCAHKMATTIVVRRWGVSWKMGYELTSLDIRMFPKMGVPQNGWSNGWFGGTPISGNLHILYCRQPNNKPSIWGWIVTTHL